MPTFSQLYSNLYKKASCSISYTASFVIFIVLKTFLAQDVTLSHPKPSLWIPVSNVDCILPADPEKPEWERLLEDSAAESSGKLVPAQKKPAAKAVRPGRCAVLLPLVTSWKHD